MSQSPKTNDPRPPIERVVLLALLAAVLFASPFFDWVVRERPTWYAPFILWGLLIAAIFSSNRDDRNP